MFITLVHNPSSQVNNKLVQVLIPSPTYIAHVWNGTAFIEAPSDVLEQHHWNKNGSVFVDYKIFIDHALQPDEVVAFKLIKTNINRVPLALVESESEPKYSHSLNVSGYTDAGQILFNFQNSEQGF